MIKMYKGVVLVLIVCVMVSFVGCTYSVENSGSVTDETASPTASVNTNYTYTGLKKGPIKTVEFGSIPYTYKKTTKDTLKLLD